VYDPLDWVLEKAVSLDWVPEEAVSLESHVEDVKTTFLAQRVEFSVESGVEKWGGAMY